MAGLGFKGSAGSRANFMISMSSARKRELSSSFMTELNIVRLRFWILTPLWILQPDL
jgi:hypothetical protein